MTKRRIVQWLVLSMAVTGCGESTGTQPPPTPSIALAAASAVSIVPGSTARIDVSLSRSGGFAGAVALTAEGMPAGITIAPASVAAGQASSALAVVAGTGAAPGASTITVRGTAAGVSAATTSFTLTVTQPPGIRLALTPAAATLPVGGSVAVTVAVTREGGYAGDVAVTVEGLPAGVSAQPLTIAGGAGGAGSAQLVISAGAGAVPGVATVTVRGTGSGVSHAASLALTVAPPPSFTLALTPAALVVPAPGAASFTASITRQGGFAGSVALAAENLPAGVTIGNATIAAADASALMNVVAGAGAGGSAVITIRGTAAGAAAQAATLTLTVPRVTAVTVAPAADTLQPGQQRQFTATVTADEPLSRAVTWRSSAPAVATIDSTGRVAALAAGTASITAIAVADTMVRGHATLLVRVPAVTQLAFTLAATVQAGQTVQATPQVTADAGADVRLAWTSDAPGTATVDSAGRVTGIAPGTANITARSVAFPLVSAQRSITVTPAPSTSLWSAVPLGAGGSASGHGVVGIAAFGGSSGLVAFDGSVGNIQFASAVLEMAPQNWVRRSTPAMEQNSLTGWAGSGPTDWYVATSRYDNLADSYSGSVLRWNGSGWSDTGWPFASGSGPNMPRVLASTGTGQLLGVASGGSLYRYSGGWSLLSAASGLTPHVIRAWSADSAVIGNCRDVETTASRIRVFRNGGVTPLPDPDYGVRPMTLQCVFDIIAGSGGEIIATFGPEVGRFMSGAWTKLAANLDEGEDIRKLTRCGGEVWAGTTRGRLLRLQGAAFVPVNSNGEAATGAITALDCGADGALRIGSASGLVTRRSGSSFMDEHFTPQLIAAHLASAGAGHAVGAAGVIYRWNGTSFTRIRRLPTTQRLDAVWSAGGDSFFALGVNFRIGSTTAPSEVIVVRGSGGGFTETVLASDAHGTALWGSSADNVFAVVRTFVTIPSPGRILRWNGSTWTTSLDTDDAPIALHGLSADNIMATGPQGSVWRWNGSVWSNAPSIPGAGSQAVNVLHMVSPTLAYAGNNCSLAQAGGSWRWNGTTWTDAGITAAGFPPCVQSFFGTGPNDIFAVVGWGNNERRLIRWNGSSWSAVNGIDATAALGGSGVPGLSVVVTQNGRALIGTAPQAGPQLRR